MEDNTLFPMDGFSPAFGPLGPVARKRLELAGCGENEFHACEAMPSRRARDMLVSCFCAVARNNWYQLRCCVGYLLSHVAEELPLPLGSEKFIHTVQARFDDCEGDNNHRLVIARLVVIVRPDLQYALSYSEGVEVVCDAVRWCGWSPPASVDWNTVPACSGGILPPERT